ncbi:uncharacterized protein LOC130387944 [Gadus chalcogrammus]|uniref:uncharacterized protein LOC130387944 n=1 Tax=Gadus chalcogrammus TaxID=1042646 RepID=UPI0024C4D99A|nr:uncharacterized protein LOC130387944 [Gadus chalcogrammus]
MALNNLLKTRGWGGKISTQQVKRKWENLTAKYKDLRKPQSGVATEDGKDTVASWKWYSEMDGILGQKPSISPPVVISSSGQGAAVATPSSVPCTSADDTITPPPNKPGLRELMELMERRERQDLEREREAREQEERRWRQLEEREERREVQKDRERREIVVPVRCCHTRPSSNGSSQDRTCIIPSPCLNDPLTCRTIIVIVTPMVILHNVWLNKVSVGNTDIVQDGTTCDHIGLVKHGYPPSPRMHRPSGGYKAS